MSGPTFVEDLHGRLDRAMRPWVLWILRSDGGRVLHSAHDTEDDARQQAALLRRRGFAVSVARRRFATPDTATDSQVVDH